MTKTDKKYLYMFIFYLDKEITFTEARLYQDDEEVEKAVKGLVELFQQGYSVTVYKYEDIINLENFRYNGEGGLKIEDTIQEEIKQESSN